MASLVQCSRCGKRFEADQAFNVGIGDKPSYSCEGCLMPVEQDRFYGRYPVLPVMAGIQNHMAGQVFSTC